MKRKYGKIGLVDELSSALRTHFVQFEQKRSLRETSKNKKVVYCLNGKVEPNLERSKGRRRSNTEKVAVLYIEWFLSFLPF